MEINFTIFKFYQITINIEINKEIVIKEISPEYLENLNTLRIMILDDHHMKKKR